MIKAVAVYLLIVTGVQTRELKTNGNITIAKGDSAALHCEASGKDVKIVLVQWEKSSNNTKLAVYSSSQNDTSHNVYNQRVTMKISGQHSTIIIKEALESDKGWYSCIFQTFPNGKLEGKIYLDVKDQATGSPTFSGPAAYITFGVFVAVIAIGIIFILLCYFHQRKSRVNIPNQINIILKNTADNDNQDNKQQPNKPMATSSDCEDSGDDYMSTMIRRQVSDQPAD
ncbi:T-cell immunoreceptor with Ig and ITIM domains-like [Heptranchias perlo]|uniref:T-cell immunoreceptor with Ig and ITIM domains-like n=1 Tax=Heptranchias perlo TaxID=212740 RepID=UPI00355982E7